METSENPPDQHGDERGITSPAPEEGNQSTTPPGNPPVDDEATEKAKDGLEQAGGGH